ncbi:MAG TPA: prepilin-type N-terminal cleavage/methylation domain-containing protein [Rickettsiales bacterium]|nr:prepilin-type N-terminal cleavage/methylation domain-containing protein [Rickettsiales bacterium]
MKIKNNYGFTLMELSAVLVIMLVLTGIIYSSRKIINTSRIANAINLTAQADFIDDDSLVLWLETSVMSRENKTGYISSWQDLSKSKIYFETNSGSLTFTDSSILPSVKSIKFDGSNYLESSISLNLNKYTAFIVAKSNSTGDIYDTGFVFNSSELGENKIVSIKNTGSAKYMKTAKASTFTSISNSDNLSSSPSKFYIGSNDFIGEILEIIIFDKILSDLEILKIDNYLLNKYRK